MRACQLLVRTRLARTRTSILPMTNWSTNRRKSQSVVVLPPPSPVASSALVAVEAGRRTAVHPGSAALTHEYADLDRLGIGGPDYNICYLESRRANRPMLYMRCI
jgi:hypothetical protein